MRRKIKSSLAIVTCLVAILTAQTSAKSEPGEVERQDVEDNGSRSGRAFYINSDYKPSSGYLGRTTELKEEDNPSGFLDTFSLSFVGSFNFSRMFEGIRKILEGIATFIDLRVIRAGADFIVRMLLPQSFFAPVEKVVPLEQRVDQLTDTDGQLMHLERQDIKEAEFMERLEELSKRDRLRDGITVVIGGLMQKQQCWELAACKAGEHVKSIQGKEMGLILAEKMIPSAWRSTFDIMRDAAVVPEENQCINYTCDPNKDGRELGQYRQLDI